MPSRLAGGDSGFHARYAQWLRANLPLLNLLVVGRGTAERYAQIRRELKTSGRPIPSNDLWIAALAREHRLPVVSRDRHFEAVRGLQLVTW
jgi:predicted nucleic acid-binding protein